MTDAVTQSWDALAHPIRSDGPGSDRPPWKDNAYLGFWDPGNDVYGVVHVSTSPNAEGRRARVSLSVRGRTAEIAEELAPGTFASRSIEFGLEGRVTVRAEDLRADLALAPRSVPGDFGPTGIIPSLLDEEPLQHLEQAASVTGVVAVGAEEAPVDGLGMRDRTWGYRDESVGMPEYIAVIVEIGGRLLTVLKFARDDQSVRTAGFLLGDEAVEAPELSRIRRDASGLFAGGTVTLEGGDRIELTTTARPAGFWVPMGWEREGPAMSAYDEFLEVRTRDGDVGYGLVEQGFIRRLT